MKTAVVAMDEAVAAMILSVYSERESYPQLLCLLPSDFVDCFVHLQMIFFLEVLGVGCWFAHYLRWVVFLPQTHWIVDTWTFKPF